jgi:hypothetical protein
LILTDIINHKQPIGAPTSGILEKGLAIGKPRNRRIWVLTNPIASIRDGVPELIYCIKLANLKGMSMNAVNALWKKKKKESTESDKRRENCFGVSHCSTKKHSVMNYEIQAPRACDIYILGTCDIYILGMILYLNFGFLVWIDFSFLCIVNLKKKKKNCVD